MVVKLFKQDIGDFLGVLVYSVSQCEGETYIYVVYQIIIGIKVQISVEISGAVILNACSSHVA